MPPSPVYQSYLLRFWRATPQGAWQASLQCTATNAHYTFRELTALYDFLQEHMAQPEVISPIAADDPRTGDA